MKRRKKTKNSKVL